MTQSHVYIYIIIPPSGVPDWWDIDIYIRTNTHINLRTYTCINIQDIHTWHKAMPDMTQCQTFKTFIHDTRSQGSLRLFSWNCRAPFHSLWKCVTGWRRPIGCLIFIGHFPPKSTILRGSFAKNDPNLRYPLSIRHAVRLLIVYWIGFHQLWNCSYCTCKKHVRREREGGREREGERERERKKERERERGRIDLFVKFTFRTCLSTIRQPDPT